MLSLAITEIAFEELVKLNSDSEPCIDLPVVGRIAYDMFVPGSVNVCKFKYKKKRRSEYKP